MARIHTNKRFWIGWDRHTPEHDPLVDRIVQEFLRDFNPHIRVAGGDFMTVDQVSQFNSESKVHLREEFRLNQEILQRWGITHYLEGNHEERLRRIGGVDERIRSLLDLSENLELEKLGIQFLPYHPRHGVLKIGNLKVLHGFYTNEYVARKTAMIYGTCVFGHCHRFQVFQSKSAFHNHVGFAIGMLGKLDQSWSDNRAPMGWSQGFAFGYLHKNDYFDLYSARIVNSRICINGKVYGKFTNE